MSKGVAVLVAGLGAIVLPVVLVLVVAVIFHKEMVDSIYKNVEDINDGEMPPTVTSFQSGPEVVSTIGGSGQGLNCSLPAVTNYFFDHSEDKHGKRHLVLQRFRQACVFHDLCYRHGLATYGYNQNDCDRILQNAAFRLCLYIRSSDSPDEAARCQTDSKMVLAGVSLGGANAYRAWDRSTYFEFESDPYRSNAFSVSRVVDHPFKSAEPLKFSEDSDQVILSFENVRSNVTVTCVTCKASPVLQWTRDPNDISAELRLVGIDKLPDALLQHDTQVLSETSPVWLPPRRRHAAPHLLVDNTGKNHLIWMTRNNSGDSIACIVLTNAAELLTYTLPKRDFCSDGARSQLTMVEVDMFATSPLPMEVPGLPVEGNIYATGLSAQKKKDRSLSFCSRSALRNVDRDDKNNDDQAKCNNFPDKEVSEGAALGVFQNFAIVRPGQQIFFARDIAMEPASLLDTIRQNVLGVKYSPRGVVLVVEIAAPSSEKEVLATKISKIVPFDIPDRFDPMMPITRAKDDLRFLSLQTTPRQLRVRMIDFAKDNPTVDHVGLTMNGKAVSLHPSWSLRPVLVLETKEPEPKTRLVFSRGEIAIDRSKPFDLDADSEALTLETLVFERNARATPNEPFVKATGAACKVTYTFEVNTDFPCYRAFDPDRPMRASPAAKMQASQLLIGHFAGPTGHGIAFPDFCLKTKPIILQTRSDALVPAGESIYEADSFKRMVTCDPLDSHEHVSGPIQPAPDVTMTDWPLP